MHAAQGRRGRGLRRTVNYKLQIKMLPEINAVVRVRPQSSRYKGASVEANASLWRNLLARKVSQPATTALGLDVLRGVALYGPTELEYLGAGVQVSHHRFNLLSDGGIEPFAYRVNNEIGRWGRCLRLEQARGSWAEHSPIGGWR